MIVYSVVSASLFVGNQPRMVWERGQATCKSSALFHPDVQPYLYSSSVDCKSATVGQEELMDHVIPVVDLIGHSLLTQATQRVKFFHRALIVRCLLLKQLLGKSYVWCEILCDVT